jgi:hypothetical protein
VVTALQNGDEEGGETCRPKGGVKKGRGGRERPGWVGGADRVVCRGEYGGQTARIACDMRSQARFGHSNDFGAGA